MIPSPLSIEQMYPPVPVALLVSDEWQQQFRKYFLESGEFDADPFQISTYTKRPHNKCVSVCLFKRNVNNRVPDEFTIDEGSWQSKYWNGLQNLVREIHCFPEWKVRVYVEKDLGDMVHAEFATHPQVELYRMAVNSVGASPGMLWRFMAIADSSLDVVLETDIDESLTPKRDHIRSFEMDSWSAIGRVGGFVSDRKYFVDPPRSTVKNYATMIGSCNMFRPARFNFDIIAAMRGFMAYRKSYSTSNRPWAYDDNEAPSVYNKPIGGMVYGWGSHWYVYGFDERFLKHVIYYHFAENGDIHTWAPSLPPWQMDPEGVCDLEHVRSRGNTTVFPHTAIRLAPLRLAPEALRIAFVVDEHRWIFESLLQLMHQNADTGFCGTLFFHDIAEPCFIELVPKQLNLFQVARNASNALEIGFNAGHGTAIMLLANPDLTVRAFDTCGLSYTQPCLDFLNGIFGNRITLVKGLSQTTVPADIGKGYDLVHIDADHSYAAVVADLANALAKCMEGAIVVMDDHEVSSDVARATFQRTDLVATDAYTMHKVFPGSSQAIFHYNPSGKT